MFSFIIALFRAFDRLLNVLTIGNDFTTISARVGYFADRDKTRYWKVCRWIINKAFSPVQSEHCYKAVLWESKMLNFRTQVYKRGNIFSRCLLFIIISFFSLFIFLILLILSLPGKKWLRRMA